MRGCVSHLVSSVLNALWCILAGGMPAVISLVRFASRLSFVFSSLIIPAIYCFFVILLQLLWFHPPLLLQPAQHFLLQECLSLHLVPAL